jgi:hypothetical protein
MAIGILLMLAVVSWSIQRVSSLEQADARVAEERFATVFERLDDARPMLQRGVDGEFIRSPSHTEGLDVKLQQISVLIYRVPEGQLFVAKVPFWFYRMKGPALSFVLRDSGFDIGELGLTPAELQSHGPGLILDETADDGGRVVIWVD